MVRITNADLIYAHITVPKGTLIEFVDDRLEEFSRITYTDKYRNLLFRQENTPLLEIEWEKIK
jgi:hypothetical protein